MRLVLTFILFTVAAGAPRAQDFDPCQGRFLRPAPEWSSYRTPVKQYYQCGAGTHPGGGIMGASGRLAAMRILGDKVA